MVGLRKAAYILAIGILALLTWCPDGWSGGVLVLKSREFEPFQRAVEGLISILEPVGVPVHICKDTPDEGMALADTIALLDIEVVVTVGTVATEQVLEQNVGVPSVFVMVLDPVGRGFVPELGQPGGRTTGVEMAIPIPAQLEALKETVPKARRIGVLFSTPRNRQLVEEAADVADSMGLKLIPAEVGSHEDVPSVLRGLTAEIDALWSIADPVAFSNVSAEHVILTTLRERIPFMGLSASFVKAGALLALSCDYFDLGRQAGEQVLLVLGGEAAGDIPVSHPRATALHLSLRTARLIGIEIPNPVVIKAKEVRE